MSKHREKLTREGLRYSDELRFKTLARHDPVSYDRTRKKAAKQLGISPLILDAEVEKRRPKQNDTSETNFGFETIEPWPEPVDGGELVEMIRAKVADYVVLPPGGLETVALFCLHAHAHDAATISPILAFIAPVHDCGKTTALEIVERLVPKPLKTESITPAAVFRTIEKWKPTLLLDEANSYLKDNPELLGVLNSGHRKGGKVIRISGKDHTPELFDTWGPKALAMIVDDRRTRLAPIESRCIIIPMKRKTEKEQVKSLRADVDPFEKECRMAVRWAEDNFEKLKNSHPKAIKRFQNRVRDNWRPLFAIAEAIGRKPQAHDAAKALEPEQPADNLSTMLLRDLAAYFADIDAVGSAELCEHLGTLEGRPWPEFRHGQPMTVNQLANLLRPFEIRPRQVWMDGQNKRGYERGQFRDAFRRYVNQKS